MRASSVGGCEAVAVVCASRYRKGECVVDASCVEWYAESGGLPVYESSKNEEEEEDVVEDEEKEKEKEVDGKRRRRVLGCLYLIAIPVTGCRSNAANSALLRLRPELNLTLSRSSYGAGK
jgi:hypothetical protein